MALVNYPDSDTEVSGPDSQTNLQAQPRSLRIEKRLSMSSRKRKQDASVEMSQTPNAVPPPLPSAFHSLYATNVRASTSDDPSLHGGRKRQMPHVEGNWPTHIYFECKPLSLHISLHTSVSVSRDDKADGLEGILYEQN